MTAETNAASIAQPPVAVVVGAGGGIGRAIASALVRRGAFAAVHAWSRSGEAIPGAEAVSVDITQDSSIAAATAALPADHPIGLAVVATGWLGYDPEKSWRDLDADRLARSFLVNAIGPALVAKHVLPRFPRRGRAVFAALSARVGSIGDNRLGGWYGYRASKAALNQLVRTLAIELARSRPDALCLGLHPGTVDTVLSRPFQAGVARDKLFTPERAALQLLDVIERAEPEANGHILAWDGAVVPP